MPNTDCIIIGGGAAGLFCALHAAERGRSVVVLDHANKAGKKILMSGGGRCNFTNYSVEPSNFISKNPHFCKSALKRYTPYDFIQWVESHGLAYHEKHKGQLFCDRKASDLLNILLVACERAGARVITRCTIESVAHVSNGFQLSTSLGAFNSDSLVLATGGLSIPTMGATGLGYELAKQLGLRIIPRYASLVPFTLKGRELALSQALAGISMPVVIESDGVQFSEDLLFTHRGLSGPAALQITNYWSEQQPININFLPDSRVDELIRQWRGEKAKAKLSTLLSKYLPKRFVDIWLNRDALSPLSHKSVADLSQSDITELMNHLHNWQYMPVGTEGYRTAEVTLGGIDTRDISSKTFEAIHVPGLYCIGEVLDVTGWLGGYNFQWAWSSAYCAAQYV